MPPPAGSDEAAASRDELPRRLAHLYQQGKLHEAEMLSRELLTLEPRHFSALHTLGAIHSRRGEFVEAERLIAKALEIDYRSAFAWNGHGSALRGLKRFDEAVKSYRRAIALKPDFAQAFYNLAGVMHELGQLDHALAYCDR